MEKLYTKIVGMPVRDDGIRPITTVRDVLIDPSTGNLCALEVHSGKNMVVAAMDILAWRDAVIINDADSIVSAGDILRVEELISQDIRIYKNNVESKDGTHIGKVYDFSIDSENFNLKKLYVARDILGLARYDKRIINAKDIVEILKEKIVVKADTSIVKEEEEELPVKEMAKA